MEISYLTFILTEECNYDCAYCYQKKEKKTMDNLTIETAVDFFYPLLKSNAKNHITFYGGEPLLAYDRIKYTLQLFQEKNRTMTNMTNVTNVTDVTTGTNGSNDPGGPNGTNVTKGSKDIEFSLTTNGSLLTGEILDFFHRNRFGLMLSFDGLAQETGRKKGSLDQMIRVLEWIRSYPNIDFEINSVFTPRTIRALTDSMRLMTGLGCSKITINLSTLENWEVADMVVLEQELGKLTDFLELYYKEKGKVPVTNYRAYIPGGDGAAGAGESPAKKKGIFRCTAGQGRFAVTPGGEVWGCYLFHDYFKTRGNHHQYHDYYCGTLKDFIGNYETGYPGVLANYTELGAEYYQVEKGKGKGKEFCFLCKEIEGCVVCPVNAAFTSGELGKISGRTCELGKIQRKAQENFYRHLLKEVKFDKMEADEK